MTLVPDPFTPGQRCAESMVDVHPLNRLAESVVRRVADDEKAREQAAERRQADRTLAAEAMRSAR
jgi:hypothetical protein